MKNKRIEHLMLIILIVLTAVVRFWMAVNSTTVPYPSESNVWNAVRYMTENATLDTDFYNHPDNILIFCVFAVTNLYSMITTGNLISGSISSIISRTIDASYFASHFTEYLTIARCVNVVFSLIVVLACYKIGNRLKPKCGLLAALFVALFSSYTNWSALLLSDTCLMALLLLAVYYAMKYLDDTSDSKYLYATTVFCGLATIQKYPGALCVLLVVYLVCVKHQKLFKESWRRYFVGVISEGIKLAGLYFVTCMLFAPNLVIHIPVVIKILISESRDTHLGADGLGYLGNLWFYIKCFINQSGWIMLGLFALGTVLFVKEKNLKKVVPVYLGFVMMFIMSKLGLHWERWSLIFHTSALIVGAYAVVWVYDEVIPNIGGKRNRITFKSITTIVLMFVLTVMGSNTILTVMSRVQPDTRCVSGEALNEKGITLNNTYYESYSTFSPTGMLQAPEFDFDKIEYVMISSYMYDRYEISGNRYPQKVELYNWLSKNCEKVYDISANPEYATIMDQSIYTKFGVKNDIQQIIFNFSALAKIIKNEDDYFGPTIKVYRLSDEQVLIFKNMLGVAEDI